MGKFYVTTPIYYINDRPHIGHAYTTVVADFLARYHRLKGSLPEDYPERSDYSNYEKGHTEDVFFLTGTDEYGIKNVEAARELGITPQELADKNTPRFKELKTALNLSWNDFIRTTDKEKHWPGVEKLWRQLEKNGDIYEDDYEGLYCVGCEAYITEKDLVDGLCPNHKTRPELLKEKNLFFRLSKYGDEIAKRIESNELEILPETRKNEILSFIRGGLKDVSFSRPKDKLTWGIPVPGHDDQTMYVWMDALANYITAIGYGRDEEKFNKWWPADTQIIGKDILRFHAAIWPGMLLSAGLPLPKRILVHGFITIEGEKMSKSLGNVVDPFELVEKYGADTLRYYLLREIPSNEDGVFSIARLEERYLSDLANGIGNFASRVSTLAAKLGSLKKVKLDTEVESEIELARSAVEENIGAFKFHEAVAKIWNLVHFGDGYIDKKKPWESKDAGVVFNLVALLDNIAYLTSPVIPEASEKITNAIHWDGDTLSVKKINSLFPRLAEDGESRQARLK